ncbi:MAG TPA: nucleotidyltransferase family protein [Steroidobacteraceae bacterium]
MKALLLAAGRGERMRPLTDALPKPLLTVAGRPLIAWHLAALARAGIREVVINLSWLGEQLRAALGDGSAYGVSLAYSDEGPVALETGGGIVRALPLLGPQPFLVVSGDVWTQIDFARLRLAPDALAHLVLIPNPPHHPRGDFGLESGWVVNRDSERLTYGNVGIYRPEFFSGFADGRFPLIQPLKRGIDARQVRGEFFGGGWCDVGTPARLAELNHSLGALQ